MFNVLFRKHTSQIVKTIAMFLLVLSTTTGGSTAGFTGIAREGKNPRFSWFYPKWVLAPFWAFSSPPNQPQRELAPLASLRQPQLINV